MDWDIGDLGSSQVYILSEVIVGSECETADILHCIKTRIMLDTEAGLLYVWQLGCFEVSLYRKGQNRKTGVDDEFPSILMSKQTNREQKEYGSGERWNY